MTRLLVDPTVDFDDPNPVTITATLLDPDPALVRTFEDVTAATVVDLPAPDVAEAWRLTVRRPVTTVPRWGIPRTDPGPIIGERTVHFVDGDPVAWAALTDVDPATLKQPAASPLLDVSLDELRTSILGGASAAYDTLKELEDALSGDTDTVAALTAAVAGKATPADVTAAVQDAVDPVARGDLAVMAGQLAPHFLQAALGIGDGQAHWSPGNGGFFLAPLDLSESSDGANWDQDAHAWTIPTSGLYQLTAAIRPTDGYPAGANIGMGVDFNSTGGPTFVWHGITTASRHTFQLARVSHFNAGQQVYLYCYIDGGAGTISTAALGVALIAAD